MANLSQRTYSLSNWCLGWGEGQQAINARPSQQVTPVDKAFWLAQNMNNGIYFDRNSALITNLEMKNLNSTKKGNNNILVKYLSLALENCLKAIRHIHPFRYFHRRENWVVSRANVNARSDRLMLYWLISCPNIIIIMWVVVIIGVKWSLQ